MIKEFHISVAYVYRISTGSIDQGFVTQKYYTSIGMFLSHDEITYRI